VEKKDMIYEGKAKKVYSTTDPEYVIVSYKDDATAFNGQKKGTISDKGVMNNKISSMIFEMLDKKGIPTHFERILGERDQLCKRVKIVPLEVIVRNVAAGSLAKRLGVPEGSRLACTVLEFCYKNDELGDPLLNDYHIMSINLATREEIDILTSMSLKVNDILMDYFRKLGIDLIDFKLEFGRFRGEIVLADEISPDTCRFWDAATHEKLDKDRFRRDLGNVEGAYREILARIEGN
jgi:phosphoribosylaminoimidazole-succinocarboxamide synthase